MQKACLLQFAHSVAHLLKFFGYREDPMPLPEFKALVDEAKSQIEEVTAERPQAHATVRRRLHPH